jgi:tetratricopeptide (TPR) repeat protein
MTGIADAERLRGHADEAAHLYEESLAILRAEGDSYAAAAALHNLGHVALMRGEPEAARRFLRESLHAEGARLSQDEAIALARRVE